jgi:hypothetical protein
MYLKDFHGFSSHLHPGEYPFRRFISVSPHFDAQALQICVAACQAVWMQNQ